MCERQDPLFFDGDSVDPIDSESEQIEASASNILLNKKHDIDPVTTAALLLKSRTVRLEHFRDRQPDIDDISWHILLDLMISMDSEEPVSVHDLAITHNLATNTMTRYVKYLSSIGLIDQYIDAEPEIEGLLKLTASGAALISDTLKKIGNALINI
tara:strand:+ start:235 stop:702 length:468 start_codon:yes stop_codon:yes gene_type:complete